MSAKGRKRTSGKCQEADLRILAEGWKADTRKIGQRSSGTVRLADLGKVREGGKRTDYEGGRLSLLALSTAPSSSAGTGGS